MFGLDKEFKTQVDTKPFIVIVSGISQITVRSEGAITREFYFNEYMRPSGQVNTVSGREVMRTHYTWMDESLGPNKKIQMVATSLDGKNIFVDMSLDEFLKNQAYNFRPAIQAVLNVSNYPTFPASLRENLAQNASMLGIGGIHH